MKQVLSLLQLGLGRFHAPTVLGHNHHGLVDHLDGGTVIGPLVGLLGVGQEIRPHGHDNSGPLLLLDHRLGLLQEGADPLVAGLLGGIEGIGEQFLGHLEAVLLDLRDRLGEEEVGLCHVRSHLLALVDGLLRYGQVLRGGLEVLGDYLHLEVGLLGQLYGLLVVLVLELLEGGLEVLAHFGHVKAQGLCEGVRVLRPHQFLEGGQVLLVDPLYGHDAVVDKVHRPGVVLLVHLLLGGDEHRTGGGDVPTDGAHRQQHVAHLDDVVVYEVLSGGTGGGEGLGDVEAGLLEVSPLQVGPRLVDQFLDPGLVRAQLR